MLPSRGNVTDLLVAWNKGEQAAFTRLVPLVYDELRQIARRCLRQERPGHMLEPTELVHEAWAQLVDKSRVPWQDRAHFFGVAARTMRRILVDHARKRQAARRGGAGLSLSLEEPAGADGRRDLDLIWLDEALNRLAALDARQSQIVELRYFTGLTIKETAEVLAISTATVKREWDFARACLHREMSRP